MGANLPIRNAAGMLLPGGAALAGLWLLGTTWAAEPAGAAECAVNWVEEEAASVVDARAVALQDGRVVRLAGIEPFSLLDPGSSDAEPALEQSLRAMLDTVPVRIHPVADEPDRYGRIPALLAFDDGALAQEILAREGLAIALAAGGPFPCFDRILAAEDEGRENQRGFWAGMELPRARPEALAPFVGGFAIFEGVVVSVGNRRSRTYLNFGGWWAEDVTVEIDGRDRDLFGGEAGLAALAGRRVRVRGFVEEKQGPMLRVRSPMHIERLDGPASVVGEWP